MVAAPTVNIGTNITLARKTVHIHTIRPITKRPKLKTAQAQNNPSQNDTRTKQPKLKTAQGTKRPKLKTTQGTKRPKALNDPRHKKTHNSKFRVVLSTRLQHTIIINFQGEIPSYSHKAFQICPNNIQILIIK
jgi:hypothetical protein